MGVSEPRSGNYHVASSAGGGFGGPAMQRREVLRGLVGAAGPRSHRAPQHWAAGGVPLLSIDDQRIRQSLSAWRANGPSDVALRAFRISPSGANGISAARRRDARQVGTCSADDNAAATPDVQDDRRGGRPRPAFTRPSVLSRRHRGQALPVPSKVPAPKSAGQQTIDKSWAGDAGTRKSEAGATLDHTAESARFRPAV